MPLRYVPAVHKFKELVAEGYLGQLARVQIVLRFPEWPRRWQQVLDYHFSFVFMFPIQLNNCSDIFTTEQMARRFF